MAPSPMLAANRFEVFPKEPGSMAQSAGTTCWTFEPLTADTALIEKVQLVPGWCKWEMEHYEQFPEKMGMIWRAGFNGYLFKEELHGDRRIKFTSLISPWPCGVKCSWVTPTEASWASKSARKTLWRRSSKWTLWTCIEVSGLGMPWQFRQIKWPCLHLSWHRKI
mmetsp:Transcript_51010/g.81442  ORF Transcript_51010/g.81442 Transcript_51010/m.81442 type:complete len:165 (+) Transcript_51010:32-526(+)